MCFSSEPSINEVSKGFLVYILMLKVLNAQLKRSAAHLSQQFLAGQFAATASARKVKYWHGRPAFPRCK
jgi:hypothetical protein